MSNNPTRRDILQWSALATLASLLPAHNASAQNTTFSFDELIKTAKELSKKSYEPPILTLPEAAQGLSVEQYRAIRAKDTALRRFEGPQPLVIEPMVRGFVYTAPVALYAVRDGKAEAITFDANSYDMARAVSPESLRNLGFSGFRLRALQNEGNTTEEFAIFQAASFFRAMGKGQTAGVWARGLAIGPAEARGEEFPIFRSFWIERRLDQESITIYALLDSPSTTGAYRLVFRQGDATITDVEATLFPRSELAHIGLAPMTSMFLFAGNDRRGIDDARPAAHKSQGLCMQTGKGEWIWRSLQNPDSLQISAFVDQSPRGFGLMQRQRDPLDFDDEEQKYENRPNLWVEPQGDWGQGSVVLLEIPTDTDINDNIMAYWRPAAPLSTGTAFSFRYRLHWSAKLPQSEPRAEVSRVRVGRGSVARRRRFVVHFNTPPSWEQSIPSGLRASLSSHPIATTEPQLSLSANGRFARVQFEFEAGNENKVELRMVLMADSGAVSETWLYRWTP